MAGRARRDAVRKKLNEKLNQDRQEKARQGPSSRPPRVCYASLVHRQRFHLAHRPLCALTLLLTLVAAAQQAPSGQKIIKDPAEYNAYMAALNTQDATARAEALESFAQQYPRSVVLIDALQQEMAAWQDSGNVRVLGIVVALDRMSAEKGDAAALNEMCIDATGGMRAVPMWRKPANMTDADFASLSKLMNDIFIGAEGYCAVEEKNYSQARDWLTRAIQIDPANVQDLYQLAIADLETTPADANGFWYCARAIHLAQTAAMPQNASGMVSYCKAKYTSYHGADDGWDAMVAGTAAQDKLPRDFARDIQPAPNAPASPQK